MKFSRTELTEKIKVHVGDQPRPPAGHWPPSSESFDSLVESIKRMGMLSPVFVDREMWCTGGHYRLWAAKKAGLEEVPVVLAETMEAQLKFFLGK